jgi:hypothetical protein
MVRPARLVALALLPLAAVACAGGPTAPAAEPEARMGEVVPWYGKQSATTASATTDTSTAPRKAGEVVPWY